MGHAPEGQTNATEPPAPLNDVKTEQMSPTARTPASFAHPAGIWILAVLATVFFLREARDLLIPIALAILISYALEPVVAWLERRRVPRMAGAALVLLVILALLSGGAYILRDDAVQVVEALPQAAQRAREIVLTQFGSGSGAIQEAIKQLGSGGAQSEAPAPLIQRAIGALFTLAGNFVIIFFLIFFLLISGHQVRDRLVQIAGPDEERRRTALTVVGEINAQIQRYLL